MKSKHRHDLETNVLANKLGASIEQLRPYSSTILGVVVAVAVVVLGVSYYSGATNARQSEAWTSFNRAVEGPQPDLDQLRQSAEAYAGTPMQQWADVTWADGQVWTAAGLYIQNRTSAIEALNRATGTYRILIEDSDDPRLVSRAHFGLGRVYELRGELDKAREEYLAVRGGFEQIAQRRAEDLAKQDAKDVYAWLATAKAPRRTAPSGRGTPGQRPAFSAGGLDIPSEGAAGPDGAATSFEDLFKGFELPEAPDDRYKTEDEGETADDPASDATESAAGESQEE